METNRETLVAFIADKLKQSESEIGRVVDALVWDVLDETEARRVVHWPIFGAFSRDEFQARRRVHPHTGVVKVCPSGFALRFNPALKLRKKIAGIK